MEPRKPRAAPLPIETAATLANVSPSTLYRAIRRGELRAVMASGRRGWRVLPEDLEAFLQPRPVVVAAASSIAR